MPVLRIQTNAALPPDKGTAMAKAASVLTAAELGKPERYVMVIVEPLPPAMVFGGTDAPAVFAELKSIGLAATRCGAISEKLCGFFQENLGVAPDRVYIGFENPPGTMWGWNGGTF